MSPGRRQAIVWTNADIVNRTLRNKLQWNFNSNIFIQENAFENVVWEMVAILAVLSNTSVQIMNPHVTSVMYQLGNLNELIRQLSENKYRYIGLGLIPWLKCPHHMHFMNKFFNTWSLQNLKTG